MPQLTSRRRNQLVGLLQSNMSLRAIARQMDVSHVTVRTIKIKWETELSVDRREGSGRHKVTTQEEDDRLVAYVRENPFTTACEARSATRFSASTQTVRRRLFRVGLEARHAAVKEILTEAHKAARLNFAHAHVGENEDFWGKVLFSDEKNFSSMCSGPVVVYRPRNTRYDPQYVKQRGRSGRFGVNVWGWIYADGPGVCWRIDGHLDGQQYVNILNNLMLPSAQIMFPDGFIYQQAKVHETISPIVTWRKNYISDAPDIANLMGSQIKEQFGNVNLPLLIERAYFSISQVDSDGKIASHVALFDYPNVPTVPPWDWINWAKKLYGYFKMKLIRLKNVSTRNTLFIHLMTWDRRYSLTFLKPLISIIFFNCSSLENLLMVVPPGITPSKTFEECFTRLLPKTEKSPKIQTIYLSMRQHYFPKLNIRAALEEDHDDLFPIIDKQNSKLRSLYGDYYMGDVVSHTSSERKVLAAERNGIGVGVMTVNTMININHLVEHFELKSFNDLHKPDSQDKWVSKPLQVASSLQGIDNSSNDGNPIVTVYEGKSSDKEIHKISNHVKVDPSEPIGSYHEYNWSRYMVSVYNELIALISVKPHNSFDLNTHRGSFSVKQEELCRIADKIRLIKHEITHPSCWRKENAFCIELLAVHEGYDGIQTKDLLIAAFELFPECDFCFISLPFNCPTFPLIEHFVRCRPKCYRTFPHELLFIHRNSALSAITVRYSNYLDINVCSLLKSMDFHKEIDVDFLSTIMSKVMNFMTFIVESEGTAVGIVIMREENDITYIRSHYNIEIFNKFELTDPADHGEILHMALSPIFQRHSKFVIREVLRLSGVACIFYKLYPRWLKKSENPLSIMTALGEMIPIQPIRQQRVSCLSTLQEEDQLKNDIFNARYPFALYMMNAKLTNQLTVTVNTRIIIVGASTAAMSLLESMIFSSAWEFLTLQNITLVSPHGLPYGKPYNGIADMFVMDDGFYSSEYLAKLSLCTWVNSVFGLMTSIDRRKKKITVNYDTALNYDYLIILTGEQFQDELQILHNKLHHNFQRKDQKDGYINSFCINSCEDADEILEYLKKNFCELSPRKIIIYGHSIEAYLTIAALRKSHYAGEHIVLVENLPSEDHSITCFNNDEVYHGVMTAIKNDGIKVLKGYHLTSWNLNPIKNEVTKVVLKKKTLSKSYECLVFINCGKKCVNQTAHLAISKSSLAYNGRLVIEPNFSTNDPNIFAAGPLTKYPGHLHAEDYEHRYYNSREIGKKMCKELKYIWDPKYLKRMGNRTDKLLRYKKPLVTICMLPGGWNYVHVCKPGIQVPLNEAMSDSNYGKVLIIGDCLSEDNGYFRIHINSWNIIEMITCYTKKHIDVRNFIKLYGKHGTLLNNLTKRYEIGYITDFQEYFCQTWITAISDDRFSRFLTRLLMSFKKFYAYDKTITNTITNILERMQYKEETEADVDCLEKLLKTFLPKRRIELKMLEFIQSNWCNFPLYAVLNDRRITLT